MGDKKHTPDQPPSANWRDDDRKELQALGFIVDHGEDPPANVGEVRRHIRLSAEDTVELLEALQRKLLITMQPGGAAIRATQLGTDTYTQRRAMGLA